MAGRQRRFAWAAGVTVGVAALFAVMGHADRDKFTNSLDDPGNLKSYGAGWVRAEPASEFRDARRRAAAEGGFAGPLTRIAAPAPGAEARARRRTLLAPRGTAVNHGHRRWQMRRERAVVTAALAAGLGIGAGIGVVGRSLVEVRRAEAQVAGGVALAPLPARRRTSSAWRSRSRRPS